MRTSWVQSESHVYGQNGHHVVEWAVGLEWMVVAVVVVEHQQEVVALQLEVVKVQVSVEAVEWPYGFWMPPWSQSCVEVQE